ncbi:hypothetical protein BDZ91DRAFT_757927 [Kalaharituber pfeilii]|nr:hypothetical protein BDZ91DRAFT_757927 [Kalaharituber pfeilii]
MGRGGGCKTFQLYSAGPPKNIINTSALSIPVPVGEVVLHLGWDPGRQMWSSLKVECGQGVSEGGGAVVPGECGADYHNVINLTSAPRNVQLNGGSETPKLPSPLKLHPITILILISIVQSHRLNLARYAYRRLEGPVAPSPTAAAGGRGAVPEGPLGSAVAGVVEGKAGEGGCVGGKGFGGHSREGGFLRFLGRSLMFAVRVRELPKVKGP